MTWPTPGTTALDRARIIARTYRAALTKLDPHRAAQLDAAARRVGETWIADPTTGQRACTVAEAATLLGLSIRRVQQLVAAGDIPSAGRDNRQHALLVRDVLAYRDRDLAPSDVSRLRSPASG